MRKINYFGVELELDSSHDYVKFIAFNENGKIYGYRVTPVQTKFGWYSSGNTWYITHLDPSKNITWTDSLIEVEQISILDEIKELQKQKSELDTKIQKLNLEYNKDYLKNANSYIGKHFVEIIRNEDGEIENTYIHKIDRLETPSLYNSIPVNFICCTISDDESTIYTHTRLNIREVVLEHTYTEVTEADWKNVDSFRIKFYNTERELERISDESQAYMLKLEK